MFFTFSQSTCLLSVSTTRIVGAGGLVVLEAVIYTKAMEVLQ